MRIAAYHGYPMLLALPFPARPMTRPGHVILVDRGEGMEGHMRYVVADVYGEDREWSHGQYLDGLKDAVGVAVSRWHRRSP